MGPPRPPLRRPGAANIENITLGHFSPDTCPDKILEDRREEDQRFRRAHFFSHSDSLNTLAHGAGLQPFTGDCESSMLDQQHFIETGCFHHQSNMASENQEISLTEALIEATEVQPDEARPEENAIICSSSGQPEAYDQAPDPDAYALTQEPDGICRSEGCTKQAKKMSP